MYTERNLCHESDCPDLCCRGIKTIPVENDEELQNVFPQAKEIPIDRDLEDILYGLYFYRFKLNGEEKKRVVFNQIVCPNNSKKGCENKPKACYGFLFGGEDCNTIRKRHNLPEIAGIGTDGKIIYKEKKDGGLLSRFGIIFSK